MGAATTSRSAPNLPDVLAIRVTDAAGRSIYPEEFADAPDPGIEGRAYFARLRDECLSGVVISPPHRDGREGTWVIDIVRRIEYPDGRFAGAVVAPVPVERLVGMLAAADVGPGGAVGVRGEGLELIARHPPGPERSPANGPPAALLELVTRGEISGTFHATSAFDGIDRLYSYRKVAGYPLHVTVGRATDEYMGHWRRDMGAISA